MKNVILGMFAVAGVVVMALLFTTILLTLTYYIGFVIGFILQYLIGMHIVFGLAMPNFIGIIVLVSNIITMIGVLYFKGTGDKINLNDELKKYRGY